MNVRAANKEDIDFIVNMYSSFCASSGYLDIFTVDNDDFKLSIENFIDNGTIYTDGETGVLAFSLAPTIVNHSQFAAQEHMFFVSQKGNGLGAELIKESEIRAKELGAKVFIMSTPISDIGKYYTNIGYKSLENSYIKEL